MKKNFRNFTHEEVIFILRHYQDFSSGLNIETPEGLNNPEVQRLGRNKRASFEDPCLLAAEVSARVHSCGADGSLVEDRFGLKPKSKPISTRRLAKIHNLSLEDIHKITDSVTWYCTGKNRKKESYDQWKNSNGRWNERSDTPSKQDQGCGEGQKGLS